MWPFTKKEPKPDWRDEGEKILKSFRDIGQTFNYLGRTCIVVDHWEFTGIDFGSFPKLICNYADDHGVIRRISFSVQEIAGLEEQNPRE